MMNKSRKRKILTSVLAVGGFVLAGGVSAEISAQRDPFAKPAAAAPKSAAGGGAKTTAAVPGMPKPEKPKPPVPTPVAAPPIQDRIAYYKRLRESAALQNQAIPKVTSVLTLDEMSVTGIFRTPRGYAAMVEAKPIKLSYTIYPGEKFFDGQLVAIEENKLVFRKVTKWTNGKFIAAEESKPLRQYSVEQEVQGTAPVDQSAPPQSGKTETASAAQPQGQQEQPAAAPAAAGSAPSDAAAKAPAVIASPLEEMNKQLAEQPKDADAKDKKPAAKNKKGKAAKGSSSAAPAKKSAEKVAKNSDQ